MIHRYIELSYNATDNMLLFADDMLVIQERENILQKSKYELQKISNNYNFYIFTTKIQVMAFQGK
jgi:hypothetical protein